MLAETRVPRCRYKEREGLRMSRGRGRQHFSYLSFLTRGESMLSLEKKFEHPPRPSLSSSTHVARGSNRLRGAGWAAPARRTVVTWPVWAARARKGMGGGGTRAGSQASRAEMSSRSSQCAWALAQFGGADGLCALAWGR